jgi:mannose-6-phosphate isomerase-like protein (cupin superfamily)
MNLTRRDFASALPLLLAGSRFTALQQGEKPEHLPSQVYPFDDLPVQRSPNLESRPIMEGQTFDGCKFSVHESWLQPNSEPHPPHHHQSEEMFFIIEGTLEVTINGAASRISGGSVAFIASGDQHGVRNVGLKPAKYFVLELGPQK